MRVVPQGLVVEPHGRGDRLRQPVDHHVRQDLVLGEARLLGTASLAVRPALELLQDPRKQAHGTVVQSVGKTLGLGALYLLIGSLVLLEVHRVRQPFPLVRRREQHAASGLQQAIPVPRRHRNAHVDVQGDAVLRILPGNAAGDNCPPVAALGGVLLVPELQHQPVQLVRHEGHVRPPLPRRLAPAIAGDGGDDAVEARGREEREDLHELHHGPWPAVHQQERDRRRVPGALVYEVRAETLHRHREVVELVQRRLVPAPVIRLQPVPHEVLQFAPVRPVGPRAVGIPAHVLDLVGDNARC
mmetsp:Transcript_12885/g.26777  ORF Transcript_12885/g.26777 Transcript_12885/m.26777 type:complete len:300 (+) Transcript_12885:615-1514(+)